MVYNYQEDIKMVIKNGEKKIVYSVEDLSPVFKHGWIIQWLSILQAFYDCLTQGCMRCREWTPFLPKIVSSREDDHVPLKCWKSIALVVLIWRRKDAHQATSFKAKSSYFVFLRRMICFDIFPSNKTMTSNTEYILYDVSATCHVSFGWLPICHIDGRIE